MAETDFWTQLEWRLDFEFMKVEDERLRSFWCDGISPREFVLHGTMPFILELAWICFRQESEEKWNFTLVLPRIYESRQGIAWDEILPGNNVTEWLKVEETSKRIEIAPALAVYEPNHHLRRLR